MHPTMHHNHHPTKASNPKNAIFETIVRQRGWESLNNMVNEDSNRTIAENMRAYSPIRRGRWEEKPNENDIYKLTYTGAIMDS